MAHIRYLDQFGLVQLRLQGELRQQFLLDRVGLQHDNHLLAEQFVLLGQQDLPLYLLIGQFLVPLDFEVDCAQGFCVGLG